MSTIAQNLARIQSAKADIKTAIEAKGVTVPSSATIDTYDDYVSQISGGGGGVPMPSNLSSASFNENGIIQSLTFTASTVPNDVYKNNTILSSVTLSSGVTSIGDYAFNGCTGLTSIDIPSGVTSIGDYAFQNCKIIGDLIIPSTCTYIGVNAFSNNTSITTITLEGITPLVLGGNTSFPSERQIYVPCESVHTYRTSSFAWAQYAHFIDSNPSDTPCTYDTYKVRLYNNSGGLITEISRSKTSTGGNLTSAETSSYASATYNIDFGDAFCRIYDGAFKGFTHISGDVTVPDNVIMINSNAFSGCSSIQTITIGKNVYSMYRNTFANCTSLQSITITKTSNIVSLYGSGTAFQNTNNCPIYVPADLVNTYKSASGWSTVASRIQAIPNS
jgi:hypothetical protein